MHAPSTPGEILAGWLEDLDMSVTAFAAHVGISRVMLSRILHGHAAVTADMDLRLHEALEHVLNDAIALRFAGYGRPQTLPDRCQR